MHKILTVKEVAVWLKVHPTTIYRLLRRRGIPAFRVFSEWRFRRDDLDLWLEQITLTQGQIARTPHRTQHAVAMSLKPK